MINNKIEIKYSPNFEKKGVFAISYLLIGEELHELQGEKKYISSELSICIDSKFHIIDHFAMHLNHSDNPNSTITNNVLFAIKDIKVGEELTLNWNEHNAECKLRTH
jgi:SET domain-containing protein